MWIGSNHVSRRGRQNKDSVRQKEGRGGDTGRRATEKKEFEGRQKESRKGGGKEGKKERRRKGEEKVQGKKGSRKEEGSKDGTFNVLALPVRQEVQPFHGVLGLRVGEPLLVHQVFDSGAREV